VGPRGLGRATSIARRGSGTRQREAEGKLAYNLLYVKHLSLLLDVAIVLETAKVMLLEGGR